jgi:hypothetical protein
MNPEAFQIFLALAAASAGAISGFVLCAASTSRKVRAAERRAWREAEGLQRARAIQDLRDRTSARL